MNKFSRYLDITPNEMFSLYDYPIQGKDGLPLFEKHGKKLEMKEVVIIDREATELGTTDHCWVCGDYMGKKVILFLIAFLITFFLSEFVFMLSTYTIVNGAKSLMLINNCEMVYIDKRLQPVYTVVLDCPGKDSIRLWPLPWVDPWFEDWWEREVRVQVGWGRTGEKRLGIASQKRNCSARVSISIE